MGATIEGDLLTGTEGSSGLRTRGRLKVLAATAALGLAAAGCGGGSTTGSTPAGTDAANKGVNAPPTTEDPTLKPKAGGKLVFAVIAETDGWDPAKSRWAASGLDISNAIFDKLAAYDESGHFKPLLAQAIESNADFTEWTIKVRPGVKFHDGTPVDGAAIQKNLKASKASPLTGGALGPIKSVELSADGSVVIPMTTPWSTFPVVLTGQVGTVAAPSQMDSPEGQQKPVGSGPFKFESWSPGSKLVVKKNNDYWQKGQPLLDGIEFRTIADNQSRSAALRSKDIDGMENYDPELTDSFRTAPDAADYRILRDPKSEEDEALVMLNEAKPPFDDLLARRALAHATDPKAVTQLLSDNLEVATGPYSKESKYYADSGYPSFDLEAAKKDVAEYKAKHGGKFEFQLDGIPVVEVQKVEQLLQQQWAAAGLDVKLSNVEQAPLISQALGGNYQATMWRQFSAPSPDGEYVWWHSSTAKPVGEIALNFARNKDPEIDKALDGARATSDEAKQRELWGVVQKRHGQDLPYIWLYHVQSVIISSNRVHDITKWNLPDGKPALGQISVLHGWGQVWVS